MKLRTLSLLMFLFCMQAYAQEDVVLTSQWEFDGTLGINAKLNSPGTYSVAVLFTKRVNVNVSPVYFASISSGAQILRLRKQAPEGPDMDIEYLYAYIKGESYLKTDSTFIYTLPFASGKEVKIQDIEYVEPKGGEKTPIRNFRKLSFSLQKGDTIRAMRKGKVIDVVNRYTPSSSEEKKDNSVLIQHPDGSMSEYAGLEKGTFAVQVGDVVYPGDAVALAGSYDNQNYHLRLGLYFIQQNKKATDIKSAFSWVYIDPIFSTTSGNVQLVDKQKYGSPALTTATIQKEMSKKEIKALGK